MPFLLWRNQCWETPPDSIDQSSSAYRGPGEVAGIQSSIPEMRPRDAAQAHDADDIESLNATHFRWDVIVIARTSQ